MRKLVLFAGLLLVVVLGVMAFNLETNPQLANGIVPTPTPAPWEPAQLRIDALHINASVMSVGATANGVMDAPTSKAIHSPYWTSVFWYNGGAAPGQTGNAVIAGHVDRVGGDPAIFWSLSNLVPGNMITVVTHEGKTIQFVVNRVVSYAANAPSQDVINAVFGTSNAHHLNLITCSGVWTGNGYDSRLVVFTTQVDT